MNSSETSSKLPMWVFFVADAVFVGAAILIARRSSEPLSPPAMWAIVACVFAGAIVGLVPLLLRFERQKNELLDDRQHALEALARTVSSSAEQISIAAGGLHEIAELAQKNLRQAEQLPHKLQDKIADFQSQLANVTDGEKEELEKELAALRSSETERLESIADKIARATAELAKLEAATHQHLAGANEAVAKLALGTASAIGKAQAAAEQALSHARVEAARALGEATGHGTRAVEAARTAALAELDARIARHLAAFDEKIARLEALAIRENPAAPRAATADSSSARRIVEENAPSAAAENSDGAAESAAPSEMSAPFPKRPRKPRREEPPVPMAAAEVPATAAASSEWRGAENSAPAAARSANGMAPDESPANAEPAPISASTISEVAPVVPPTAPPFVPSAPAASQPLTSSAVATDAPPAGEPARKKSSRKPAPEPTLNLDLDDSSASRSGPVESTSLTSDGATRLLVTAYIGIGNRLFIRGEGPGLSWEKGVPLQFISIGKWRWETNDASGPVRFKLLKNDETECVTLGAQTLDPGHQQEITAAF